MSSRNKQKYLKPNIKNLFTKITKKKTLRKYKHFKVDNDDSDSLKSQQVPQTK